MTTMVQILTVTFAFNLLHCIYIYIYVCVIIINNNINPHFIIINLTCLTIAHIFLVSPLRLVPCDPLSAVTEMSSGGVGGGR